MKKDIAVNFRVDELSNQLLVKRSEKLGISKSAYLCQLINSYDDYEQQAKQQEATSILLKSKEQELTKYKERMTLYQTSKLNELFRQNEGKEFNGKVIRTEGDLLRLIVDNFEFSTEEGNKLAVRNNHVALSEKTPWYGIEKILSVFVLFVGFVIYYVFFHPNKQSNGSM